MRLNVLRLIKPRSGTTIRGLYENLTVWGHHLITVLGGGAGRWGMGRRRHGRREEQRLALEVAEACVEVDDMKPVVSIRLEQPAGVVAGGMNLKPEEERFLVEIGQLGGAERRVAVEAAMQIFEATLSKLVQENPAAYGLNGDAAGRKRLVREFTDMVTESFLWRTVESLRRKSGYVCVWGFWIHRAAITFVVFGFLLAAVLPVCVVSLMSAMEWGWLPGVAGIILAIALGVWILSRVRWK